MRFADKLMLWIGLAQALAILVYMIAVPADEMSQSTINKLLLGTCVLLLARG